MFKNSRFLFFACLATIFIGTGYSQNIDSLKFALKAAKHDTTKIIILNELINYENDEKTFIEYNNQMLKLVEQNLTKLNQSTISASSQKYFYLKHKAKAINNQGSALSDQGEIEKSLELFLQSKKIYEEIKNNEGIAACQNQIGVIYVGIGEYSKAMECFSMSLKLSEEGDNLRGMQSAYNNIAGLNRNKGDIKKALEYFEKSLDIAIKINEKVELIEVLNNIGTVYHQTGNNIKALEYHIKSLSIAEEFKSKNQIATGLNNIAMVYTDLGDIPKALENYHRALVLNEEIKNKEGMAIVLNNIGAVHQSQGDPSKAIEYFNKCLKLMEEMNNKFGIASAINNIGLMNKLMGDFTHSLDCYNKSLKIFEEIDYKEGIASALNNLGSIFKKKGNPEEAIRYYLKALAVDEEIGHKREIATTLTNIGVTYFEMGNTNKAQDYGTKSLMLANELGYPEKISAAAALLRKIYLKQNNFKKAYEMYEIHITMRDSVNNKQTRKASIKKQIQYDYDKKAAADSVKNSEQIVQENIKHELAIKQQRIYTYGGGIGFAFMLIIAIVSFKAFKNKQKANIIISEQKQLVEKQKAEVEIQKDVIEAQKHLVEEHQKEIIDSITYAKRLQEAILPPQKLLNEFVSDNFILYQPKDIVAGDFYWMEALPCGTVLLAAADSTGHGVPGAMVSVVCSNALNRAVKEFNLKDTGSILDKTRELVLDTFAKSEGEVKDGMDVSLLSINIKKKEIFWSGANNQLWYIENGTLMEITANKQPIGKTENSKPFTTHTIKWNSGNIFYLMTDGYPDQFGGPKGKKFKYKQLEDLLTSNCSLSLSEQKEILSEKFSHWKGNLEQVDDVTIIGLKI